MEGFRVAQIVQQYPNALEYMRRDFPQQYRMVMGTALKNLLHELTEEDMDGDHRD